MNQRSRIPGSIGWGVDRPELRAASHIITDDQSVDSFPIKKDHVTHFDKNKTALFTRLTGTRAALLDQKLGVDYDIYHALNLQAQRASVKNLDLQRKLTSSVPQHATL